MAFAALVVYVVLSFVRPAELYPQLERFQIMDLAAVALLGSTLLSLVTGRREHPRAPQLVLVLAFAAWAPLTVVLSEVWFGGALQLFLRYLSPAVLMFYGVALNVDTSRRVRLTAIVLSAIGVFLGVQSTLAYHYGVGARRLLLYEGPNLEELGLSDDRLQEELALGIQEGTIVVRARSLGFLNDPNDLAQALVAILPFLLALRRPGRALANALLVWAPAGLILYTLALTRSRGGVLSLATVVFLTFRQRLGRGLSVVLSGAALGTLLLLGFVGSRSFEVDESAQGRTEAWYVGIQMLKASPLWGVGLGFFGDHHERVAHNSFVHCFAETGLVGYFIWLAVIVLTLSDLRWTARGGTPSGGAAEDEEPDPDAEGGDELARWAGVTLISLAGFLTGALFLSRTYNVTLFLLLGVGVGIAEQARRRGWYLGSPSAVVWTLRVGAMVAVSVILVWLAVRSLG